MVNKELRKMSRRELVDIIYQQKKNEQKLQDDIAFLKDALQEKRIRFSEAGSIAEAAASVTELFSAAQKTADLYLYEISCMKEDTEKECRAQLEETRNNVAKIISESEAKLADLRRQYQFDYERWRQLQTEIGKAEGTRLDMGGKKTGFFGRFGRNK